MGAATGAAGSGSSKPPSSKSPKSASASGDMLTLELSVEQANTLLNATFKSYVHDATNTTMVRTLAYSLPESVHDHVSFIYPTTQYV